MASKECDQWLVVCLGHNYWNICNGKQQLANAVHNLHMKNVEYCAKHEMNSPAPVQIFELGQQVSVGYNPVITTIEPIK